MLQAAGARGSPERVEKSGGPRARCPYIHCGVAARGVVLFLTLLCCQKQKDMVHDAVFIRLLNGVEPRSTKEWKQITDALNAAVQLQQPPLQPSHLKYAFKRIKSKHNGVVPPHVA